MRSHQPPATASRSPAAGRISDPVRPENGAATVQAPPDGAVDLAVRLLRLVEGCELSPYLDTAGVPTIGVGCTRLDGAPVTMRTPPITQARADAACRAELDATRRLLAALVRVPLTAGRWAATASLAYNIGGGAFAGSTVLRRLNADDPAGAARHFADWNRAGGRIDPGLVHRRMTEAAVFATGALPRACPIRAAAMTATRPIGVPARYDAADALNVAELARIGGQP